MSEQNEKPVKGFASYAQMDRCRKMVEAGTMTQEQFDKYHNATKYLEIPDRIHPKKEVDKQE